MATRNTPSDVQTEIQSGTRIKGRVQGSEGLVVAGTIEGQIELEGRLTVETGGVVKAEVRAHRVSIQGTVVGNVTASEIIEIGTTGRVQGDLRAPTVRIDDGARFSGLLEVGDVSRIEVAPRPAARAQDLSENRRTQVAGIVPDIDSSDERRRKRVVVKKRD